MDRQYIDANGQQWTMESYDYMENTDPGHHKFYRAATVIGPHGNWEFTQWGRIEASPLSAQKMCHPTRGVISAKLHEKRARGYNNAVDSESSKIVWSAIVSTVIGIKLGDGAPLWVYEFVPTGAPKK